MNEKSFAIKRKRDSQADFISYIFKIIIKLPWIWLLPVRAIHFELRLVKCLLSFSRINKKNTQTRAAHTVWMKAEEKIIRIVCKKKKHFFPYIFFSSVLLYIKKSVEPLGCCRRRCVSCTQSAKELHAKIRLDIYREENIRISFVFVIRLVSAFLRVIHIQWCVYRSGPFCEGDLNRHRMTQAKRKISK